MEDLCERPRKLIHEGPRSQYLDTLAYKDIRNTHKARPSKLLNSSNRYWRTHEAL